MTTINRCLAAAILLVLSHPAGAQEMSQVELATKYYLALYAGDHDTVRTLASSNMVFEDTTAPPEFGLPERIEGLEEFLAFMKSSLPDQVEAVFTNSFASNNRVVLVLSSQGTAPAAAFGMGDGLVSYAVDGVSVLQIEDGLVVRHSDYFDYPGLSESLTPVE